MTGVQTCDLRSEEHTSELQSHDNLVCRLLLEKNTIRSEEHTSELQSHDHLVCRLLLENRDTGALNCAGGFSPGFASRLVRAAGRRVFVKAMSVAQGPFEADQLLFL